MIRVSKDSNWHLLSDFLDGDAKIWFDYPDLVETTCGGNAFWWKFRGEDVLLTFQHGLKNDPGILISKELLWNEIRKRYKLRQND